MADTFSFNLTESAAFARKALQRTAPAQLERWEYVVRNYRERKRHLIDALNPDTGRRVLPFVRTPTAQDNHANLHTALTSMAVRADVNGAGHIYQALVAFRSRISTEESHSGAVAKENSLLTELSNKIRPGMRLTRALSAWLTQEDAPPKGRGEAKPDAIAAQVFQEAQIKPREGFVALSANIADLLLCSECCTYGSCHSLTGCHAAGPQQYLADAQTVVAYYWEETQDYRGQTMPRKLYRQIIHIDRERSSALLMREYGSGQSEEMRRAVRGAVAELLAALAIVDGKDVARDAQGLPNWIHTKADLPQPRETSPKLAYIDGAECAVQLLSGSKWRPVVRLAEDTPCGACAGALDCCERLVCESCDGCSTCESCDARISDEEIYCVNDGVYCETCYRERFVMCEACHEHVGSNYACTDDDGNYYCEDCYSERFTSCEHCSHTIDVDDTHSIDRTNGNTDGPYCQRCYDRYTVECYTCSETRHEDDCSERDGEQECETCATARVQALYVRLTSSRRWRTADVFDRASLRLRFSDTSRVMFHCDDSAVWPLTDPAPQMVIDAVRPLCEHAG